MFVPVARRDGIIWPLRNSLSPDILMPITKAPLTPQRRKVVLWAVVPAMAAPIVILLTRTHEAPIFLGLSGQFWAGVLIGLSLVALAAAAYQFHKLSRAR